MLNSFWNWFVIILTVVNILACWWLLYWTKGISGPGRRENHHRARMGRLDGTQ